MRILLYALVFWPMLCAVCGYILGRKSSALRTGLTMFSMAVEFALALCIFVLSRQGEAITASLGGICGFGLHFTLDGFRALYTLLAAFMWLLSSLFSPRYFAGHGHQDRYWFFIQLAFGATVGLFLSADVMTTFIFFEIMSLSSYPWVAQEETSGALRAADTYMAVAIIGGLVALMGVFLLQHIAGTLNYAELKTAVSSADPSVLWAAALCLAFGFGAKAGMFPLHIWLPKAHPVAPAPASALLSGMLTKTGVFGLIFIAATLMHAMSAWGLLMLGIGLVTMLLGALLALFSVDLKRTLACSSVSQIGFIVVGIGMLVLLGEENALAACGTLLHMMNHSLIKLCLFLCAGVVYMNVHKLDLNEIRGFGRNKPLLMVCFLLGGGSLAGIPLLSGYASKTLLHESIVEKIAELTHAGEPWLWLKGAEWLFLIAGGMTTAYMLKLFIILFIEKNTDAQKQAKYDQMKKTYLTPACAVAIALPALLLVIMGILPGQIMMPLAESCLGFFNAHAPEHAIHFFSWVNLSGAVISLSIGILLYFFVVRMLLREWGKDGAYLNCWPAWLDLENNLYRPLLLTVLPTALGSICHVLDAYVFDPLKSALIWLGTLFGRAMDKATDSLLLLLRLTLFRDNKPPVEHPHEHHNTAAISSSFSFALLVTCLGICAIMLYVLLSVF